MPRIDPTIDGYEATIIRLVGHGIPWKVQWAPFNWVKIKTSLPWVHSSIINNKKVQAADYDGDPYNYPVQEPEYHDNDHILIFPQDTNGVCPLAWIEAAWPFITKFRSDFTLYPEQAALYSNITLIGHPDVVPHIDTEYVAAITKSEWRNVERIACRNSSQLREILQTRIENGHFFGRKDIN